MGSSPVQEAATQIARLLSEMKIDYAIAGALCLAAHGVVRATEDVDVLIAREGLERFKQASLGQGYVDVRPGGKAVRDTVNGVKVDFLIEGDYPGDGKPKPVSFPLTLAGGNGRRSPPCRRLGALRRDEARLWNDRSSSAPGPRGHPAAHRRGEAARRAGGDARPLRSRQVRGAVADGPAARGGLLGVTGCLPAPGRTLVDGPRHELLTARRPPSRALRRPTSLAGAAPDGAARRPHLVNVREAGAREVPLISSELNAVARSGRAASSLLR